MTATAIHEKGEFAQQLDVEFRGSAFDLLVQAEAILEDGRSEARAGEQGTRQHLPHRARPERPGGQLRVQPDQRRRAPG